jgi:hypothetical protein
MWPDNCLTNHRLYPWGSFAIASRLGSQSTVASGLILMSWCFLQYDNVQGAKSEAYSEFLFILDCFTPCI